MANLTYLNICVILKIICYLTVNYENSDMGYRQRMAAITW